MMIGSRRRSCSRASSSGAALASAWGVVTLCLLIVAAAAAATAAVGDAAEETVSSSPVLENGPFEISVLTGGSEALDDLFEVCAHPTAGAVEQTVDKDGVCGGREIVSLRPAEGKDSVFLALYKTSGGGQYGLAVSLLGACEAALAPGARTVTVDFVVTPDRVLHISTPGGLSGVNCRTELPLDSPALFAECQEPLAECERDSAARLDDVQALLGDMQEVNDQLQAQQDSAAAEREALAAELAEARAANDEFAEALDASRGQLQDLKAAHGLLEEEHRTLENAATAAAAARAEVEAQLQVTLKQQHDEMALRKSAEAEAEELRQALTGTQADLESQFVALRSKLSEVTNELHDVAAQKAEISNENRELAAANAQARAQADELQHRTDKLSSDKEGLETALADLRLEMHGVREELSTVSEERDSLRTAAASDPHALVDVLMAHKEKLVLGAGTALAIVIGLTALIVRSRASATTTMAPTGAASNSETKQPTKPAAPGNKGQKKKLARAEALAAAHKKELEAAQSKIAELEGKELPELRHLLREAQHKFKREIESACARQAADHEAAEREMNEEIEQLKLQLQHRGKELETAQTRLDDLKSEHSTAEGGVEELRRVNKELQEASRQAIAEHAELRVSSTRAEAALAQAEARAKSAEAAEKRAAEELVESCKLETELATTLAETQQQLSALQQQQGDEDARGVFEDQIKQVQRQLHEALSVAEEKERLRAASADELATARRQLEQASVVAKEEHAENKAAQERDHRALVEARLRAEHAEAAQAAATRQLEAATSAASMAQEALRTAKANHQHAMSDAQTRIAMLEATRTAMSELQEVSSERDALSRVTEQEALRAAQARIQSLEREHEQAALELEKASASSAAEHEKHQAAFAAEHQALLEERSRVEKAAAAHAASKADLEARVSNVFAKWEAEEAKSQALLEKNTSVERELALLQEKATTRQAEFEAARVALERSNAIVAETQGKLAQAHKQLETMTRAYEAVQQHGGLQNAELQDISNEMRTEFSKWQEEKKALHEEKAQLEQQVAKLQSALSDEAEANQLGSQKLSYLEQRTSSEADGLRRKLLVCEAEIERLQEALKQLQRSTTTTDDVSLSPSDDDDDEDDDAQVDLVKAPVFKVPQERLLRTPPSARNIRKGAKLTHHHHHVVVDSSAVLSKNSGANLTHREKLRRQSIQKHSTPARNGKSGGARRPSTTKQPQQQQVSRSRRDSDASATVSTPRYEGSGITFGPTHGAPAWFGHNHSTATSPTNAEATALSSSSQLVTEGDKVAESVAGEAEVPTDAASDNSPNGPRVKSLTVDPSSRASGAQDEDVVMQGVNESRAQAAEEATTPLGGTQTPTFEDRLEAEAAPSAAEDESADSGFGSTDTPPPTIAARSPSRSKSPGSRSSRRRSGSASRSKGTPTSSGGGGSSSSKKQKQRLDRVKAGGTPRQSPRPGVGFGSSSDRGLSPARRGSLSSTGSPGTPGTPGSVGSSGERRTPRIRYRKANTPKIKYDSKTLNPHTHVDPHNVWE